MLAAAYGSVKPYKLVNSFVFAQWPGDKSRLFVDDWVVVDAYAANHKPKLLTFHLELLYAGEAGNVCAKRLYLWKL
jgi:hypothetical protein